MNNRSHFSLYEYATFSTADYDSLSQFGNSRIERLGWHPNSIVIEKIHSIFCLDSRKILDVGGGSNPFKYATDVIDILDYENNGVVYHKKDLDCELLPFSNLEVDFCYSRHTIEDIYNPLHCVNEMFRVSNKGFIETPSPFVESIPYVDGPFFIGMQHKGYMHHRWIIWSELHDNSLHILPKYGILEHYRHPLADSFNYLLNNKHLYWNNYYLWNETLKPKVILYKHGVNFDITRDYFLLIERALKQSMLYTNQLFANTIK